jgi:hypothetical protein
VDVTRTPIEVPDTQPYGPGNARVEHPSEQGRRRRIGRRLLILLGLVALLAVLAVIPALAARSHLEDARSAMEQGRERLLDGDTRKAEADFVSAEQSFASGLADIRNPFVRLVSFLPILGRSPDTTEAIARAGGHVAQAARETVAAINGLPDGLAGFAPRNGTLPVDSFAQLAPTLQRAGSLLGRAGATLRGSERTLLLGPVGEARAEFESELVEADETIRSAELLSRTLPSFLGGDGPKRYFFGAQNPAELRGTGGFLGAFSILTIDKGRLTFGPFLPVHDLANVSADAVEAPNLSYARRYSRFGSASFWPNINITPDFPSSAQAIETLYEMVEGVPLDGTIVADPFALQALLKVAGPVEVPSVGETIDADNAIPFLTKEAYARFETGEERKRVLGDAARAVFDRFINEAATEDPVGAARALIRSAADGHVLLHAADPEVNAAFEIAGVGGALQNPDGDFLGVIANSAALGKLDYYLEPSIRYAVRLHSDGSASATATVRLSNTAPEQVSVTGPHEEFAPGENRTYVSTYCAAGCRIQSFKGTGEAKEVETELELGHPVFSTFATTLSGETSVLEYRWTVPDALVGNRYALTFQGQPTIQSTQLEVDIQVPDGISIVSTSPRMEVEGNRAVWSGEAERLMRFDVALQRPLSERAWGVVVRFIAVALIVFVYVWARWLRRTEQRTP